MSNVKKIGVFFLFIVLLIISLVACGSSTSINGDLQGGSGLNVDRGNVLDEDAMNIPNVQMMDENVGWSVFNNSIYRTVDGGRIWLDVTPSGITTTSDYVYFHTGNRAFIASNENTHWKIYYTKNGGGSWETGEDIPVAGAFANFSFHSKTEGSLMITKNPGLNYSEVILLTTKNGGKSWSAVIDETKDNSENMLPHSGNKTGIAFKDHKNGWIVGVKSQHKVPWIYKTADGGISWKKQDIPTPKNNKYEGVWTEVPNFFNDKVGMLFVQTYSRDKAFSHFYTTNDGGETWSESGTIENKSDYLMHDFVSSTNGWMSDGKSLYRTEAGLQNWIQIMAVKEIMGETTDSVIVSLEFVSETKGWLIIRGEGNKYILCDTNDGGMTWNFTNPKLMTVREM
ncbi:hypothetical protein CIB95_11925 [Lottiidibacillus patelloidae]|uniref:Sortilin N-terminal domain-containing protein n=1 Tax=Lottiidibacillus patelloidae TaxID=2670334 RepID=A0A263BSY3_9BACI|nr:hypothetical protein [Lottiidibacillus patelloidae]OZM56477.1 hypothetical protein CIB95_11925 [Lottiidibacillus patelloidae]